MNKDLCVEYFRCFAAVFTDYNPEQNSIEIVPLDIISLKSIFDFFMIFDMANDDKLGRFFSNQI